MTRAQRPTSHGAVLALLLLVAMLASLVVADRATADASATTGQADGVPATVEAAAFTTSVVEGVSVHSGEVARVAYRADSLAGGAVVADLLVTTSDGVVVRRLTLDRVIPVGVTQMWRGRLRLRVGTYRLVVRARDELGAREVQASSARLTVLAALPPRVPTASAVRRALAWAATRGDVCVAVVDSRGRFSGHRASHACTSASVVKAMLLVQYLRGHRAVSSSMRYTLSRMICYSDNSATDAVYGIVGRSGLVRLADAAGMRGFRPSGSWITTRITAADMARFFLDMERYVPARHRSFANGLLADVTPWQRWGIPAAAEPLGYTVYFKGGWLGPYLLANQAARLERGRVRIGLAVFTDGNPAGSYGQETIRGLTARLLRQ